MAKERASSSTDGIQPLNEVHRRLRYIHRLPPQLSRRGRAVRIVELADEPPVARLQRLERLVRHGRLDPIEPAAKVELPRRGEGGAGDLLGVEAVGAEEGAALAVRESSGESFGGEVVVEAGLVLEVGGERILAVGFDDRRLLIHYSYRIGRLDFSLIFRHSALCFLLQFTKVVYN